MTQKHMQQLRDVEKCDNLTELDLEECPLTLDEIDTALRPLENALSWDNVNKRFVRGG